MLIGAKETTVYQYKSQVARRELVSASAKTTLGQGTFFPWPWCPKARGLIAAHRELIAAFKKLNSKALRVLMS